VSRELLSVVLFLLAVLGVVAVVLRLGRELVRLALNAAESTAATGLAEVSERRGDITGLMERRAAADTLRRGRRLAVAQIAALLLLLAVPPFLGVAREVYAAAALLWFIPARKLRPRLPVHAPEQP
jgi:hypothetical protein